MPSPPPPRPLERASCLAAAILYKLKKGQKQVHANVSTIPTLNFNVENCRYGKIRFSVWVRVEPEADRLLTQPASRRAPLLRCTAERAPPALPDSRACTTPPRLPSPPAQDVGGQDSIRPLWRHYYTGTQGLIYVVDSNDSDRVRKAAEELHKMVLDHEMRCATAWPARPTPAPSALLSAPAARAPRRIWSTSLISISPPFGFGAIRGTTGFLTHVPELVVPSDRAQFQRSRRKSARTLRLLAAPADSRARPRRRFAVVLVFANKVDLPHSLSPDEITREMRCGSSSLDRLSSPLPSLPALFPCPRRRSRSGTRVSRQDPHRSHGSRRRTPPRPPHLHDHPDPTNLTDLAELSQPRRDQGPSVEGAARVRDVGRRPVARAQGATARASSSCPPPRPRVLLAPALAVSPSWDPPPHPSGCPHQPSPTAERSPVPVPHVARGSG